MGRRLLNPKTYEADIVWGCAVAVDRLNGGYVKADEWGLDPGTSEMVVTKRSNKLIVKSMLARRRYESVTEEDIAEGQALRQHYNGYLLKELSGKINDFERSVLRIAQMNELTNRSLLEFAIISCLPSSFRREIKHKEYQAKIIESVPIDADVGDIVVGELIICKCYFNENYERFKITGRFGESFCDFWFKEEMEVDSTVKIKGRVKQLRLNNTAQLHYVKVLKG